MPSAFVIDDARPLADVLTMAVAQAGLSISDEPVERAHCALVQQLFVNAYTMRFKRQRTGDWDWLQKEPFHIPMCLADLIGHCLDQKIESDADNGLVNLPSKAALKFLLGDAAVGADTTTDQALFSPSSVTLAPVASRTPTLAAIRLGPATDPDEEPLDHAQNMVVLDDEGEIAPEKRSRSESPRPRRSLTKSRHHSSKRSRSSRSARMANRQTLRSAAEPPQQAPVVEEPPLPPSERAASPLKVVKRDSVRDGSVNNRVPRRSVRDSSLVRSMTAMLKRVAEPLPFNIDLVHAIPLLQDDDSSCDNDSTDSSGSDIDSEGRRPRRAIRMMPADDDNSPINSGDQQHSASKRREVERSMFEQQHGNGMSSPKRKRLNYFSER